MAAEQKNEIKKHIDENEPLSEHEQKLYEKMKEKFGAEKVDRFPLSVPLRFIRGYRLSGTPEKSAEEKTFEVFEEFLNWREKEKVDEMMLEKKQRKERIAKNEATPEDIEEEKREKLFKELWLSGIHGVSRSGHPIYVDRIGQTDTDVLLKHFTLEDVKKYHVQTMEELVEFKEEMSRKQGHRIYKHVCILDMKGFGWALLGGTFRNLVQEVIHIDQHYYPESLLTMIVCNAGFFIKGAWAVVSPWLDPITKERIKLSSDYLSHYICKTNIPKAFNGACACEKCLVTDFVEGVLDAKQQKEEQQLLIKYAHLAQKPSLVKIQNDKVTTPKPEDEAPATAEPVAQSESTATAEPAAEQAAEPAAQ